MTPSTQFEPSDAPRERSGADNAVLLRVEGIRAGYGKKEILHGADLDVQTGEIVALAGANGAGKSTFLKVVAGLLKPTAGTVQLDGKDVTSLPAHHRSRLGVGYLLQGGEVFPSLTVQENLGIAIGDGARDSNAIEPVLSLFPPLRGKLQQRAGLLSGGERQMLALAMVLVTKPRLLLFDEPTAALAPSIAAETLRKVSGYCLEQRMSLVLVEQRIRDAFAIAHRCFIMAGGRVAPELRSPGVLLADSHLDHLLLGIKTGAGPCELPHAPSHTDLNATGDL